MLLLISIFLHAQLFSRVSSKPSLASCPLSAKEIFRQSSHKFTFGKGWGESIATVLLSSVVCSPMSDKRSVAEKCFHSLEVSSWPVEFHLHCIPSPPICNSVHLLLRGLIDHVDCGIWNALLSATTWFTTGQKSSSDQYAPWHHNAC